mmetsp:Transcript_67874/g.196429  ORF Transcript_67874/g.196429 Transcript_67874/m.196429 type:complete len:211 (+) Transcript_67874:424-1056(+)
MLLIANAPSRAVRGNPDRQIVLFEGLVASADPLLDTVSQTIEGLLRLRRRHVLQHGVHRTHRDGIPLERADDEIHAHGPHGIPALHQPGRPEHRASGMPTSDGLTEDQEIGLDAVQLLCASCAKVEGPSLIEDQGDVELGARLPDPHQPVPKLVYGRGAGVAVRRRQLARRRILPPEPVDRVDDDRGDLIPAPIQQGERLVALILQDQAI